MSENPQDPEILQPQQNQVPNIVLALGELYGSPTWVTAAIALKEFREKCSPNFYDYMVAPIIVTSTLGSAVCVGVSKQIIENYNAYKASM